MEAYLELERAYTRFVGSKHAVSCNSGTAALHLALMALGIGPGDEVVVPDFTMGACAFAVSYTGAIPVFADVNAETYALEPSEVERLISKKTKAIMAVHVYGRLAPMKEICRIARAHKIPVIEDACEAQGAVYRSEADVTVYSFYRNKIVPAEEGGMVTTDSNKLAERVAYLKNMAFDKGHTYFHEAIGYNYRMANAEALIALKNLKQYKANAKKRRQIEALYDTLLPVKMPKRDAVWFYEVRVPTKAIAKILKQIPKARAGFKPLSSFPMYGGKARLPVSAQLGKSIVLLPAGPDLSALEIKKICTSVARCLR